MKFCDVINWNCNYQNPKLCLESLFWFLQNPSHTQNSWWKKAWAETPNPSSDAAKDLIDCDSGTSGDESQEDSTYNYNVGENSAVKNLFNELEEIYDAVIDE